jgi:branched-chain amino acid transport system permease protein
VKLAVTTLSAALTAIRSFFYPQYILFLDSPSAFSIDISIQIALFTLLAASSRRSG